jgi:hypothetical protein
MLARLREDADFRELDGNRRIISQLIQINDTLPTFSHRR